MIRIGIVDDEKQERDQLKQALARFSAENGTELNVQEFDCAAVYLAAQDRDFDILYLDIDMPQMSGMELSEKIRETDQDVILIFCTNLQQFALNGYSVGALGFIVKPIQWYSFHMYLTRALKALQKRAGQKVTPPHIVIKDGTVTRLLDAAEIAYVEVRQHDLLYNLCGGDGETEIIKNRGSMQEIAAQLTPLRFCAMQRQLSCEPALHHGGKPYECLYRRGGTAHRAHLQGRLHRSILSIYGKKGVGRPVPVINWILNQQVQLGMILCAGLFVPWGQRRSCFVPRLAAGVWGFLALTNTLTFLPQWAKLLLYTALLFGLIWFSFDCSPLHALFYTTCAYAVQHIASKLAYMPIIWLIQHGHTDRLVQFVILLFSNLVVCLVIYLLLTRRIRRGRLLFDNVKTVLYSGFFLIAAVYLSVVLENVLDSSAESYMTAYLALNAFCILFAITILALEFSNCSIKSLEHENEMLAQLLECDKQQYEQAKKDMEKINIRYHDLKQQYSRATDEERTRLEEEMNNLNLRYLTGNKALDITLTQKSVLCGQAGIQLVCSADGSCLEDMKHYHIYSLLGNALDNAIECLMQVNDASKRVITLDISRCRDMAVIRVQNYTPAPPTLRDGAIVTTKQDTEEHGYGIKSIKSIAELYGGTADCFVEDSIFYLVVTFPCGKSQKQTA